jgi:hypothetical protein
MARHSAPPVLRLARSAANHCGTDASCTARRRIANARFGSARPLIVDDGRLRSELRRRGTLVAHIVYECSVCGDRFVGQRRCPQDNLFCRALGLGGYCTDCEQPILLADLLELEVLP